MSRKIGMVLSVLCYAVLLYLFSAPVDARYGSAWAGIVGITLAVAGGLVSTAPLLQGKRWGLFTSLAVLIILFAIRMATDPRCLVVLNPHQHGCHTFMIAIVVGVVGLALAGFSRAPAGAY